MSSQQPWKLISSRDLCAKSGARISFLGIDTGPNMPRCCHSPVQQSGKKEMLDDKQSAMKHKEEILQLLEAVCLPKQVTVMHCKGSQINISSVSLGNQKAVGGNRGSAIALQGPTLLLVLRNHSDPSSRNVVTDYKNPTWERVTRIFRGLRRKLSLRTSGRPEAHLQDCSNIAPGTVKQSR